MIAATAPPDRPPEDEAAVGTQESVPASVTGVVPAFTGTCQSKIFVRLLRSFTTGGGSFSIQWMRWSNHLYVPSPDTFCHLTFVPASALRGIVTLSGVPKRIRFR